MVTVMFLLVVSAFGLGFAWHDQSAKETVNRNQAKTQICHSSFGFSHSLACATQVYGLHRGFA